MDFLVETESKENQGEENGGHHQAQENSRRWVEVLIDLHGPNKRYSPENHCSNASKVNDVVSVFHAAKVQFFEIAFS